MAKQAEPKVRGISDVLPKMEFYPDLPRADWKSLVDCMIVISDAKIIETDGDYGKHLAALIKYALQDDVKKEYTCITSGQVVLDKMGKLIALEAAGAGKGFPVAALVIRKDSEVKGRSPYYDLI